MFTIKVFLTSYRLEINGRRYDRQMITKSSLNRLMTAINNQPADMKTVEVEDDLSVTLYVFALRKPVKAIEAEPVTVMNAAVAIEPATVISTFVDDEIECMSCREIVLLDDIRDGICCDCRDKCATVEEESDCLFCGGSGWTDKWRFGHSGGYQVFSPCPRCNG
jgi:hypothetical protein